MELIAIPPKVNVTFRLSLLHNLLTTVGLLYNASRIEGLSDWIRQAEARLTPKDLDTLNPLGMCMLMATGLHGFLVDQTAGTGHDFERIWATLNQVDHQQIQWAAQQSLHQNLVKAEIIERNMALPQAVKQLARLVEQALDYYADNWQAPPNSPLRPIEFSKLLLDAEQLRETILGGVWHIWKHVYQAQAAIDWPQQQRALDYHAGQDYNDDFPQVFRVVTGRTLPERMSTLLPRVRQVEMMPTCHIGAYITISMLDDRWWIGFNANLVHTGQVVSPSVAELYPALKALADETRLKMVMLLANREMNVGDIADELNLTQSTASRHLSLLAKTDILGTRRDGTMRYYVLNPQALKDISHLLNNLSS